MFVRWMIRVSLVLVATSLTAFVVLRELNSGPRPKSDPHGHAHGHGHQEGATAKKGPESANGTKGTEDGKKTQAAAAEKGGHAHGGHGHAHGPGGDEHGEDEHREGFVKMTAAQIEAAHIEMAPAVPGTLLREISAPARIVLNRNRLAKVVPKVGGTVATINKQVGDPVAKGDVLAVLDSRELADAKSEYLAALRAEELAKATLRREERLWKSKVTAEQEYLNAKNAHEAAEIRLDQTHQRLHTMGLNEEEVSALSKHNGHAEFRLYELRSPIAGRVLARTLVLGEMAGADREAFSVGDLDTLWAEIALQPADLALARPGQDVRLESGGRNTAAKVIFVSPAIDPDTRSAQAVAEFANETGSWQPGAFAAAYLLSGKEEVPLLAPLSAVQTIKGQTAVFVSESGGFQMRPVVTGRQDQNNIEILSGLEFGEIIAVSNAFVLKAELGKAEAQHQH